MDFTKTMAKLSLYWPCVYDPPAPIRLLIQMMNQSKRPLMTTHLQGEIRHFLSATGVDKRSLKVYVWFNFIETWPRERNKRNVITTLSLSSDWVGATHVQHKKTNTYKSLSCSPLLSSRPLYSGNLSNCQNLLPIFTEIFTSTELACLQPLPPAEKISGEGAIFYSILLR